MGKRTQFLFKIIRLVIFYSIVIRGIFEFLKTILAKKWKFIIWPLVYVKFDTKDFRLCNFNFEMCKAVFFPNIVLPSTTHAKYLISVECSF